MTCTIYNSSRYTVQSHNSGATYTIFRKSDNESVFIPCGVDANAFSWDFDQAQDVRNWARSGDDVCDDYFSLYS